LPVIVQFGEILGAVITLIAGLGTLFAQLGPPIGAWSPRWALILPLLQPFADHLALRGGGTAHPGPGVVDPTDRALAQVLLPIVQPVACCWSWLRNAHTVGGWQRPYGFLAARASSR
jgi:hypothetical protein